MLWWPIGIPRGEPAPLDQGDGGRSPHPARSGAWLITRWDYLTDDRRGAQVIFTFNSHARRQLREKVPSWDLVVTGVAISGDSQLMEDGLQLTECEPAVPIATRGNILEHFESEIPVPPQPTAMAAKRCRRAGQNRHYEHAGLAKRRSAQARQQLLAPSMSAPNRRSAWCYRLT